MSFRGKLLENSKEISSVALLSPACYLYLPEGVKENPKSALNDHIGIAFKSSWALPATSFTNVPSHKRFQLFCVEKCHPGHETRTS